MKAKDEPSSSTPVVKRGRGRPRKVIAEPAAPQVVKRGRGRPRKAITEPASMPVIKRGRGRPRKSDALSLPAKIAERVVNKITAIAPVESKPFVKIEYFHFRPNKFNYILNGFPRKGQPVIDDLEPGFSVHNPFPHGGLTICMLTGGSLLVRAGAYCSYSDVFSRRKGRELSYQRASAVMDALLVAGITDLEVNVKPLRQREQDSTKGDV